MPLASSSSGECVFSVRLEAMFLTMFDLPPVGVTPRSPVRSCVFKFSAGSCVDPLGVFVWDESQPPVVLVPCVASGGGAGGTTVENGGGKVSVFRAMFLWSRTCIFVLEK